MAKISSLKARQILDSRGNPTIEVDIASGSIFARAAAPSGASTGIHEALELRDGDKSRFGGKGVLKAVSNANNLIAKKLVGSDCDFRSADKLMLELDGTENKGKLGANATVATSLAIAKAQAQLEGKQLFELLGGSLLPSPMFNVLNGGMHAGNKLAIQEFMIMPVGCKNFSDALRAGAETYQTLKSQLKKTYGPNAINVGDEGGFAPNFSETRDALNALVKAIAEAGYSNEVKIAIDAASSSFYDSAGKTYKVDGKELSASQLLDYYSALFSEYRQIISLEDPFDEEAFDSFAAITKKHGSSIQIVGDDLLVTNPKRIKTGIEKRSCTALLLKVNQIGTLSESIEAARMSKSAGWGVVVSHRSGETEDSSIADISVGISAGQIKTGAPARAERTAKYNQLLRIEEKLGARAKFAGTNFKQK